MNLTGEQRKIVAQIEREGRKIRDPHARKVFYKAAVETGLVESGLRNLPGGDADSAGWRQERASLYADPTNIAHSVRRFREEFEQHYSPGEKSYEVAAQVQRPRADLRGRYHDVAGQAGALLKQTGGTLSNAPAKTSSVSYSPGVDNSQLRQQLLLGYLANRHDPNALLNLKSGLDQAQDTPGRYSSQTTQGPSRPAQRGNRRVVVDPNADRAGARTHRAVIDFLQQVADTAGHSLRLGTGTNHSRLTVDGNVSEHWSGNAGDVPATGRRLIQLGQAALIAAGMPRKQARRQTGGLFNVNGYQVIFNTHEGGDHTNHLHVGVGRAKR